MVVLLTDQGGSFKIFMVHTTYADFYLTSGLGAKSGHFLLGRFPLVHPEGPREPDTHPTQHPSLNGVGQTTPNQEIPKKGRALQIVAVMIV